MTSSQQANNMEIADFQADAHWLKLTRNKYIFVLAISAVIVVVLSIIYQYLYVASIRGLIFLVAALITYFKPRSVINIHIQFFNDGKIIIKKGFIKIRTLSTYAENFDLSKKGKNWLIGIKKVKVPISAFPDLEQQVKAIRTKK